MKDNKEVQKKKKINNAEECIDEGEIAPDKDIRQINPFHDDVVDDDA